MNKDDAVYTCNGILFQHKKDGILLFAAMWMNLENIMLSERNQTKKKPKMITYMWNLNKIIQ